jgi:hypothetical protein
MSDIQKNFIQKNGIQYHDIKQNDIQQNNTWQNGIQTKVIRKNRAFGFILVLSWQNFF